MIYILLTRACKNNKNIRVFCCSWCCSWGCSRGPREQQNTPTRNLTPSLRTHRATESSSHTRTWMPGSCVMTFAIEPPSNPNCLTSLGTPRDPGGERHPKDLAKLFYFAILVCSCGDKVLRRPLFSGTGNWGPVPGRPSPGGG